MQPIAERWPRVDKRYPCGAILSPGWDIFYPRSAKRSPRVDKRYPCGAIFSPGWDIFCPRSAKRWPRMDKRYPCRAILSPGWDIFRPRGAKRWPCLDKESDSAFIRTCGNPRRFDGHVISLRPAFILLQRQLVNSQLKSCSGVIDEEETSHNWLHRVHLERPDWKRPKCSRFRSAGHRQSVLCDMSQRESKGRGHGFSPQAHAGRS